MQKKYSESKPSEILQKDSVILGLDGEIKDIGKGFTSAQPELDKINQQLLTL